MAIALVTLGGVLVLAVLVLRMLFIISDIAAILRFLLVGSDSQEGSK